MTPLYVVENWSSWPGNPPYFAWRMNNWNICSFDYYIWNVVSLNLSDFQVHSHCFMQNSESSSALRFFMRDWLTDGYSSHRSSHEPLIILKSWWRNPAAELTMSLQLSPADWETTIISPVSADICSPIRVGHGMIRRFTWVGNLHLMITITNIKNVNALVHVRDGR